MEAPRRLLSVDLLRGITMGAMIVVNNPGSWGHMAPFLAHAGWGEMPRLADYVFPGFLFLVGVSTALSLGPRVDAGDSRKQLWLTAARRAGLLFLVGFFLNLFPQFDFATVRIPGVLQRIAVVFLLTASLFLRAKPRSILASTGALILLYGLALRLLPVPGMGEALLEPGTSWPVWLDERVFGVHSWRGAGDPEGILSTAGALGNAWIGLLTGIALRRRGASDELLRQLLAIGLALLAAGLLLASLVDVAKEVWTPTYALITAGGAMLGLGLLAAVVEGSAAPRVLAPLRLLGRHALAAYVLAHVYSDLSIHVLRWSRADGSSISLHNLVYREGLLRVAPATMASLLYSFWVLALVLIVLAILDRRGWRLRL